MYLRISAMFLSVVLVVSTLLSGRAPALAADPGIGNDSLVYYQGSMVADADRQVAAARVKALMASVRSRSELQSQSSDSVALSGAQSFMDPAATLVRGPDGKLIPDYFGDPNWAYSPLLRKFVDSLPGLGPGAANNLGQYIPVAVADNMTYGTANNTGPDADYYEIAVVEYAEKLHSDLPATRMRGYVQLSTAVVPGAHIALSNPDGSPIMMPDGVTRAYGVDNPHYLGPTIVATGAIGGSAGVGKPVRIKFYNLLPAGAGGDLFLPVDTTVMGSGKGPNMAEATAAVITSGNTTSVTTAMDHMLMVGSRVVLQDFAPAAYNGEFRVIEVADATHFKVILNSNPGGAATTLGTVTEMYQDNRATIHLHGNNTVWISDGTPHQWVTPASENTSYPKGVSVVDVPDMPPAGDGAMTVFYSNAQSARLQFYHDHSFGITRLNVYAGEAAGYVITDAVEQDLINGTNLTGVNPAGLNVLPSLGVPLIIQDKTFVDPATIGSTDPTWLDKNQPTFGTNPGTAVLGDLWYPHVYVPAQNPWAPDGLNPFGRWMWGPWFYPPTANLEFPPVPNPYCLPTPPPPGSYPDGAYDNSDAPWEPPYMPGIPNPSLPGEAFMDTPMVNGTVYPYMQVEPKAYRFRILDGADDRFLNLQWYVADNTSYSVNATGDSAVPGAVGSFGTEVRMTPASNNATFPSYANGDAVDWPTDGRDGGVPDPTTRGPEWWQLGTEGGFLPAPVVVPNQPVGWNQNPTMFNVGNVDRHSLLLGTAERADVIVDFSAYAGQTLILYNDAPAAFPARVPQYDYYTGDLDQRDSGGTDTTQPGFGPNIRTVMQVRVGAAVTPGAETPDVTLTNLETAWAKTAAKRGVFEVSQDPIIVPQAAYGSSYNGTYTGVPAEQYIMVNRSTKTFTPIDETGAIQAPVTLKIEPKGAHDEMGGVYDTKYGRMSGMLGLSIPATTSTIAQFLPYGYASPPVEIIAGSVAGTLIGSLDDGTQIWNLTHNGVDTHTIHTHLFNAQVINRVAWDGVMLPPDPNELGWKETFRMNPLEQLFIAMRPITPSAAQVPFLDEVPNSVRLIDPTMPEGALLDPPPPAGWFAPDGTAVDSIPNHVVNFGWEYVYHCHILAHEEMDMMHDVSMALSPVAPSGLNVTANATSVTLSWTDNSTNESEWIIQRSSNATGMANFTTIATVASTTGSNASVTVQYVDRPSVRDTYYYKVVASNVVGDASLEAFPTITRNSPASANATLLFVPGQTTVDVSGMTASVPLVLNAAGVVQTTTNLTGGPVGANFTLNIPAGATLLGAGGLPISAMSFTPPGALPAQPNTQVPVSGFSFGPTGATFAPGITLTMSYSQLPQGVLPANLTVTFWNGIAWVAVPGPVTVNAGLQTVTVTLTHFTDFALRGAAASVSLGTGWNTLATPVKLQTATDTWGELAVASSINFTAAYSWNGSAFLWVDAATEMKPLDAVYVKANAAATVPFVPFDGISAPYNRNLRAGWNLVGSAFIDPTKPVTSALYSAYLGSANITGYSQVISPSGVNQAGWVFLRDEVTVPTMAMGKGYWVFMTNPATIAGFTTTP